MHEESRTIAYDYDPLYRLTAADYDDGTYFHYTYDPVGNRLTETTGSGTTTYVYDDANRLVSAGGVPYGWSDNGNLLADSAASYTYDHANRLTMVVQSMAIYVFSYNGLGDRLQQAVGGPPVNYTLDASASLSAGLAGGLTQVLSDGTNSYLYGNARIGEEQTGGWQYHLGDALGSVRQLVDPDVSVILSRAYEPFGDPLLTTGSGSSIYAFTGEQLDGTGLVYLRTRYYGPAFGRFLSRDVWEGEPDQPMSYNAWLYLNSNPANGVDPAGTVPIEPPIDPGGCHSHLCQEWQLREWIDYTAGASHYNERFGPPFVSWITGYYSDQIRFAPFAMVNGVDYRDYERAQFHVAGFELNTQLCGQIAVSAVLQLTEEGLTASTIAALLHPTEGGHPTGTIPSQLRDMVNNYYGDAWFADWGAFGSLTVDEATRLRGRVYGREGDIPTQLTSWLRGGLVLLPLVNLASGTEHRLGTTPDLGHWVVITGVSRQWETQGTPGARRPWNTESPWNWVRVMNPFDNRTEYYWWHDFRLSWQAGSASYKLVRMQRLPWRDR